MVLEFSSKSGISPSGSPISIISDRIKSKAKQRVIGIVSGKGGVGKTVVTVNLGLAMNYLGNEVTLVDADITSSNLGLHIGTYTYPTTIQDVLNKRAPLEKATYVTSSGLMIVPASIALGSMRAKLSNLKRVVRSLNGIVLVDSPPGLDNESMAVLGGCDEIIVVATPDMPSMTSATKAIHLAKKMKKEVAGIIINRHRNDRYDMQISEIESMSEARVIGMIAEESDIRKSIYHRVPIAIYNPYSSATVEFYKIASRITSKPYDPPRFRKVRNILRQMKHGS